MDKGNSEICLSGASGSPGVVIGTASMYRRSRPEVSGTPRSANEVQFHIDAFHKARRQAEKELKNMLEESDNTPSAEAIIRAECEMLNDPDLIERVEQQISEKRQQADSAIKEVFESYLQIIRQNDEESHIERSVDIVDIRDRLIQIIHDREDEVEEGSILVAEELSPREIIEFSSLNIQGIITDHGGSTSHAAIIARSMNIPAVVGIKNATREIKSGQTVILDGQKGEVVVNPTEVTEEKYQDIIDQQIEGNLDFKGICQQPNETSDGKPFLLMANIEFSEELSAVENYGAQGIGLLRTESIYLNHENFYNVDEQQSYYSTIFKLTDPKPVTIRLFDAGGDKILGTNPNEDNSYLGWRGIRLLLDEKELLRSQLYAVLKVAAEYPGRTRIMIPMITSLDELIEVKDRMLSVQGELMQEGVKVDEDVQLGIMVEVPSVALQADLFAKHVDFMSVGTNDLAQFVLAADRGNEQVSHLYDQRHPVVWRLIQRVAEAAKEEDIPVSVCGELASDPISACCLMGLGINKLSMNPVVLPSVKRVLCSRSLGEMQELAQDVVEADQLKDIVELFTNWKNKNNE